MKLSAEATLTRELVYEATGLTSLNLSHLASAVRLEMANGNIQADGKQWIEYNEQQLLQQAIDLAKQWLSSWQNKPGQSFVITSGAVGEKAMQVQEGEQWQPIGAHHFSGFGNGKTTIAEALFYGCGVMTINEVEQAQELCIYPAGKLRSAREWMLMQSETDFSLDKFLFSEQLGKPRVILIDDVGREGSIPFVRSTEQASEIQTRYYDLINYCYRQKLSVIMTSNYRLNELATFLGGATWSRLLEMVPDGFMIDITGVRDYRPIAGGRVTAPMDL
ncbi:MAG: hypothetical protein CL608_30105 [Anaerolineaceae bacterium]|nr:hypothetical protein [Anaerolineaceae bacterium]